MLFAAGDVKRQLVKKLFVVLTLLLGAASGSCSTRLLIVLYNNTRVDLAVHAEPNRILASIGPGQTAEIYFQQSQWIDFGMIAHRYDIPGFKPTGFVHKSKVKVQAEVDGRLYLVPYHARFPVKDFPQQPAGFPLVPAETADLT